MPIKLLFLICFLDADRIKGFFHDSVFKEILKYQQLSETKSYVHN